MCLKMLDEIISYYPFSHPMRAFLDQNDPVRMGCWDPPSSLLRLQSMQPLRKDGKERQRVKTSKANISIFIFILSIVI